LISNLFCHDIYSNAPVIIVMEGGGLCHTWGFDRCLSFDREN
jgi:hypothetical protein